MVSHLFDAAGFFLLRAPLADLQTFHRLTAEEDGQTGDDVLAQLARQDRVRAAVRIASSSLAGELERALAEAGPHEPVKLPARARASLLRYVTRMCSRPTPYGLFAGVTTGVFGEGTDLRLDADPVRATRTRADLGWLLEVLRRLDDAPFVGVLPVAPNPLLYRVGDRATLPTADVHGRADSRRVDFKVTEPARLALDLARDNPTRVELAARLQAAFPAAAAAQVEGMIGQLTQLNVLVTAVRPDLTRSLPELAVIERLAQVPGAEQLRDQLDTVARLAGGLDRALTPARDQTAVVATRDGRDGDRPGALAAMDRLAQAQLEVTEDYERELFQVDTRLALPGRRLDRQVADAAAEAATLMHRIGSLRPRAPHLADYHHAFIERYGLHTEVPVVELLSPELGLDVPNGYSGSPRPVPLPSVDTDDAAGHRDQALAAMTTEVLASGERILELTDERVERLTVWRPAEGPALRPSVDLFCQVAATSAAALDAGDWSLVVSAGACTDGTRALGRFFDLFDDADSDQLARFAEAEERLLPDVVHAELSYVPAHGRSANVTVHPRVRRYEISVNTAPTVPADRRIELGDIVVGALSDRFYLRWRRTGQELRVTQSHLLVTTTAPDVCRFLLEASDDGFTLLPAFDWGVLGRSPFLPRVTRGRIVLHPAQWLISPVTLGLDVQRPPDDASFLRALDVWRERWQVPRHVYLTWLDNRLLLDLDHPLYRAELAGELRRAFAARQPLVLQEMVPAADDVWLTAGAEQRRHAFEIVVPLRAADPSLVRRSSVPPAPGAESVTAELVAPEPVAPEPVATGRVRRFVPGSEWVYLKLYASSARHDALVAEHLPPVLDDLRRQGLLAEWFFVRYADPLPHLRLRVRAAGSGAEVMSRLLHWAGTGVARAVLSDVAQATYVRELERYGGPETIEALEHAFTTSSDLAAGLLAARAAGTLVLPPAALHVWAVHTLHEAWGRDPLLQLPELPSEQQDDELRREFRDLRATLCGLLRPWPAHPDPVAQAALPILQALAAPHRAAVAAAAEACRDAAARGVLHGTPHEVATSLAHMELNRLVPVGAPPDEKVHKLWQLTAAALRRRPDLQQELAQQVALRQAAAAPGDRRSLLVQPKVGSHV